MRVLLIGLVFLFASLTHAAWGKSTKEGRTARTHLMANHRSEAPATTPTEEELPIAEPVNEMPHEFYFRFSHRELVGWAHDDQEIYMLIIRQINLPERILRCSEDARSLVRTYQEELDERFRECRNATNKTAMDQCSEKLQADTPGIRKDYMARLLATDPMRAIAKDLKFEKWWLSKLSDDISQYFFRDQGHYVQIDPGHRYCWTGEFSILLKELLTKKDMTFFYWVLSHAQLSEQLLRVSPLAQSIRNQAKEYWGKENPELERMPAIQKAQGLIKLCRRCRAKDEDVKVLKKEEILKNLLNHFSGQDENLDKKYARNAITRQVMNELLLISSQDFDITTGFKNDFATTTIHVRK
jgi:hypothetical protein